MVTPRCDGILRFLGSTEFGSGEWAGVELPVKEGKTDGRHAQPTPSPPHRAPFIAPYRMFLMTPLTHVTAAFAAAATSLVSLALACFCLCRRCA